MSNKPGCWILTIVCPDTTGIVAAVADCLSRYYTQVLSRAPA